MLELGVWDFLLDLRLSGVPLVLVRYDEVTAQAQRLADDRDRDSGHSVRFLFCPDAGLRRDAV